MKQYIYLIKTKPFLYKLEKDSGDTMFVLYLFITDGLRSDSFVEFLEEKEKIRICGNMVNLRKSGNMVTITIDEYVFPDMPTLTVTIDNLITISKEFRRLEEQEVNRIKITFDNNVLSISGH